MPVDRTTVVSWLRGYETAWRERDVTAVERLFTPEVRYRQSPYEPALVGLAAVQGFWREDDDTTFTMHATPVAVEDRTAVVRVVVNYRQPREQEYTDLWVVRFGADGRAEDFEEWAYWPGRPYAADPAG